MITVVYVMLFVCLVTLLLTSKKDKPEKKEVKKMFKLQQQMDVLEGLVRKAIDRNTTIPATGFMFTKSHGPIPRVYGKGSRIGRDALQYAFLYGARGAHKIGDLIAVGTIAEAWAVKRSKEEMKDPEKAKQPSASDDKMSVVVLAVQDENSKMTRTYKLEHTGDKKVLGDILVESEEFESFMDAVYDENKPTINPASDGVIGVPKDQN